MESLKREFLELLERDVEFRYAVAGYLGLSEILRRLDALTDELVRLRGEQTKIWKEIQSLREEQTKIWEEIERFREEQTKIWREIQGIREEQTKIWKEIERLREEQVRMREDFDRMFKMLDLRLRRVERTLEKLTVDVEEEARLIVGYRLETELGLRVDLDSLILPDLELNIYGVSDDVCVVGEATVRGGVGVLEELLEKVEVLRGRYPERLRRKVIPVLYVCLPLPGLVEEAGRRGVWVLKATRDYYKPRFLFE